MDCQKYEELLSGMLDGELTPEEFRQTKTHLLGCPFCQERYREMQVFQVLFQEVLIQDFPLPSAHFPEKLRKHLERRGVPRRETPARLQGWKGWPIETISSLRTLFPLFRMRLVYGLLGALLVLITLGGYYIFWVSPQPVFRSVYQLPITSQTRTVTRGEQFKQYLYLQQHALSAAENPLFAHTSSLEYANQLALVPR